MKTLLIHHNNTAYLSESFFEKCYFFEAGSMKDVDSYITEEFIDDSLVADLNLVELVFIKISLSDNYLEYLGIRLAYHLRLDSRIRDKKFAIAFLGEESVYFLCKTYEDYSILLTEGTYKIRDNKKEIESFIEKGIYKRFLEGQDFNRFLDKIWLRPPANFESNHSIANEWGICRLFDGIQLDTNKYYRELSLEVNRLTFKKSLYFKYIEAKIGDRNEFRRRDRHVISGPAFEKLKVALIDDEHTKGWYSLYQLILSKSKADSFPFLGFSKEISKQDLIDRIQSWIKDEAIAQNACNTFLLDLRLHEDDFGKSSLEQEELTGITIYKFIKSLNPGYQIVFITASNKIWNMDYLDDFNGTNYIVKENPEYKFGTDNSLRFLHQLNRALNHCQDRICLVEAYDLKEKIRQKRIYAKLISDVSFLDSALNENGLLDKIYRCLQRDTSNQSDLHQALLYCFQFLERYSKLNEVSSSDKSNFIHVRGYDTREHKVVDTSGNLITIGRSTFAFQMNDDAHVISATKLDYVDKPSSQLPVNSATIYSAVLYFRENSNQIQVNEVLKLLFIRNNLSAHHTGVIKPEYKLKSDDIMFMLRLFDKIKF